MEEPPISTCICLSRRSSASNLNVSTHSLKGVTHEAIEAHIKLQLEQGLLTASEVEKVIDSEINGVKGVRKSSWEEAVSNHAKIIHEQVFKLSLFLADFSGGMIRLGDVCSINQTNSIQNFEVS